MARIVRPADLQQMRFPKATHSVSAKLDNTPARQTFEAAFAEHWPRIYRLLARMVGDPSEAEDLALETFYRLYRRGDASGPGFNTAGWLRRVAVNLGLHSIRSFRRRRTHELAAGERDMEDAPTESPMQIIAEREQQHLARAALARMQPRQSELLLMRYSGASYQEIAEALHLSPTSIGPLLLRAEHEFSRRYAALVQEDP